MNIRLAARELIVALAVWSTTSGAAEAEVPDLPTEARAALHEAIELASDWRGRNVPQRDPQNQIAQRFAVALDRLGGLVPHDIAIDESRSYEEKLIAIAKDRATRPEVYQELLNHYLFNEAWRESELQLGFRALRAPGSMPEHVNEEHRLIWEYLLISPPFLDVPWLYQRTVFGSLYQINSPVSLRSYVYVFQLKHGWAQSIMFGIEQHLDTPEGLQAFLECALISEQQIAVEGLDKPWYDVIGEFVRRKKFGASADLADGVDIQDTTLAHVAAALGATPRESLPDEQRGLFDQLRSAIDEALATVQPWQRRQPSSFD